MTSEHISDMYMCCIQDSSYQHSSQHCCEIFHKLIELYLHCYTLVCGVVTVVCVVHLVGYLACPYKVCSPVYTRTHESAGLSNDAVNQGGRSSRDIRWMVGYPSYLRILCQGLRGSSVQVNPGCSHDTPGMSRFPPGIYRCSVCHPRMLQGWGITYPIQECYYS